ncbi:MAG: ABC transporter permease [Chloroflexi bacterium]|nr:ABC transporter permease [Chloroflexota bacterium]
MNKILTIAIKDVTLAFRDRAALILMLVAPFVLTLGLGAVTGRFSGDTNSGLSNIPVIIVNQDEGEIGEIMVDVFNSEDLDELLEPAFANNVAAARSQVEEDDVAAAVIIPAGFSDSLTADGEPVKIEVYVNPARPVSAGVVQSIVDAFVSRLEVGRVSGQVAVTQLVASGLVAPQNAQAVGEAIGQRQAEAGAENSLITLKRASPSADSESVEFDILAYLAPGMALLFLMYTVSNGGRTILAERHEGTLPRLLTTPTTAAQVLGGKLLGIFFTGLAQVGILILASTLLFGLKWGDPLAVFLLVAAVAAGATGWGSLLAAIAKTPAQVSSAGTAMMLMFGVLGGSFGFNFPLPGWLQIAGKLTPNSWGLEGFTALGTGGALADVVTPIIALLIMAAVLFTIAVALFRRQGWAGR